MIGRAELQAIREDDALWDEMRGGEALLERVEIAQMNFWRARGVEYTGVEQWARESALDDMQNPRAPVANCRMNASGAAAVAAMLRTAYELAFVFGWIAHERDQWQRIAAGEGS